MSVDENQGVGIQLQDKIYDSFDREELITILEGEIEERGQKLNSNILKEIAEDRNIPYGAFYHFIPDLSVVLDSIYKNHLLHVKDEVKEEGYKEQLSLLKKENKSLKKEEARFQMFLDSIERVITQYEPIKKPVYMNRNIKNNNIISQIMLSDAHWGEEVSSSELGGLNEYNPIIAKERLDQYFESVIDYCKRLDITTVDINLLGDNISGRIHQELIEHTADPTVMTVLQFADYTSQWIKTLSEYVKIRKVRCIPGNHGRFDIKPSHKNKAYNNHEFYMSVFIQREVEKIVEDFVIPPSLVYIDDVFDTNIAWLHGDIFKGGTGLNPVSGTWSRDVAKLNGLYTKMDKSFDIIAFGHFHTGDQLLPSFDGTKIIVNGSLKGCDEYSLSVVKSGSRANQTVFSIENGKKGEIKYFQTIFLD